MEGTKRRGNPRTTCMRAIEERTGVILNEATDLDQDREKWRKLAQAIGVHDFKRSDAHKAQTKKKTFYFS